MFAIIVGLALVSLAFQGASALANWWVEERAAQALDAISFTVWLTVVCLAAGWAHTPIQWVSVMLMATLAGLWLSDVAERASERLPKLPG